MITNPSSIIRSQCKNSISLFDVHWFHNCCHSLTHNWLTQVNKSLNGNLMLAMATSSLALAVVAFPQIPTWLGIQEKVIDLPLLMSWL